MNNSTALAAVRQIARGELTSEAVMRSYLDRIQEMENKVQAWEYINADQALSGARAADRSKIRGALHGLPLAVKDIIDTSNMPTSYGSQIYQGHRPVSDAACVALARAAGAIILGKTVTTEFATGASGKTRNPHNYRHTPGGSSSGSPAAVACGMVPLALGTQTHGSTIRPASFCGVVGYKPTYGKADLTGVKTLASGLDTLGLFAGSVADVALLASVVTGGRVLPTPSMQTPRIGVLDTSPLGSADLVTQQLLLEIVHRLSKAGVPIRDLPSPPTMSSWRDIQDVLLSWEAVQAFTWERLFRRDALHPETRQAFEIYEQSATPESYEISLTYAREARAGCINLFADCDVLLVPAAIGEAPEGLESTGDARFNGLWSMLQLPCITLPMGRGPTGLPIGLQLVGPRGEDDRLLRVASFIERQLGDTPGLLTPKVR
ncbi:MAG: amidase [Mesorhizobium sp.]|uniref:amidase n=1 Tax=Mesorhizobium sp. TaxID=1871066 RepID=UPI000FE85CED|nr:amidase [Mesorhizobium sp.]RWB93198.1 MAG: amidase [Mesorhizobium sp.]RWE11589.1 MAG: amidase [Mesorhizobium sp.]TIS44349.1 MAG: amidase [Mesorhizobium sp.]